MYKIKLKKPNLGYELVTLGSGTQLNKLGHLVKMEGTILSKIYVSILGDICISARLLFEHLQ